MIKTFSVLLPLCCMAIATASPASAAPHYTVSGAIAGPDGGWDYASVDPASNRLFVARSTSVTAINLADRDVRSMAVVDHGHAVVPLPDGRLLLTSGHDDSVRIVDQRDGRELARMAVGSDPDAAFYDAASRRAIVMNAKAGTISLIDPKADRVIGTIRVKPGLEYGVMGPHGILFINNEDASEIETVDVVRGKAGAPIAMPGCEGPTGLAYDARSDRLLSACANGKAAVIDATRRRQITLLGIGKGPDAVILDAKRRLAFIPCGRDGVLDIVSLDGAGGPKVVDVVKTETGARTGALDPRDGTLYLPTSGFGPPAAPGGRAQILSGTFHILVIKPPVI